MYTYIHARVTLPSLQYTQFAQSMAASNVRILYWEIIYLLTTCMKTARRSRIHLHRLVGVYGGGESFEGYYKALYFSKWILLLLAVIYCVMLHIIYSLHIQCTVGSVHKAVDCKVIKSGPQHAYNYTKLQVLTIAVVPKRYLHVFAVNLSNI